MEASRWLKERATYFLDAEAYTDAIPYLQRLIRLPGAGLHDLSFAHFTLGRIHHQTGRYRLAQEHLRKAMDISGEDVNGLMLLGQAYCGDGKPGRGRETLERARRLNPKDESIELSLGLCMCLMGEFDEATEVYSRCIRINPDRPEAYVGLAQSLAGRGDLDKARETLDEAKDRLPLSLTIRLALRELDKIEDAHDFCRWVFEENLCRLSSGVSSPARAPIALIRTIMAERAFPPKAIGNAEKLWLDFLRVSLVKPRRPEPWAGAVVYTMARLTERPDITLKTLAERLQISTSIISINFSAIGRNLKLTKNDKRYL